MENEELEDPIALAGRVIDELKEKVNQLEHENQRYKDGLNKCRVFKEEVSKMLDYQQLYFKSRRKQDLMISIKQEEKVREMINPKQKPLKTLFDEAL